MAFIDDLSFVLDLLILVTAAVFYTGILVWFQVWRKDLVRANTHLREGASLLGLLGGLIGIIGLWGELTWPIQGFNGATSYDLFFFEPLLMLSILLVAFAVAVRQRLPTHFVGMLSVVMGLGVLFYGFRAYQLGLTEDHLETFLMYLAFGAVAIGVYPMTLFVDWFVVGPTVPGADPLPSDSHPDFPWIWRILVVGFLILVVLAGVAAVGYGINVAWGHLSGPP